MIFTTPFVFLRWEYFFQSARRSGQLKKLCSKPTPADFRYSDLKKIMAYFGYLESNKGATSGSRVKFYHPESKAVIMLHKPHPGDEMVKGSVESVVLFLKEHKHI